MEFMLLIAALLVISLPIFYLLGDYSLKSSREISLNQLNKIGQQLVDESRDVYYLGLFSRQIVTLNMPDNVRGMRSYIVNGTSTEYVLVLSAMHDGKLIDIHFDSEVPLVTDGSCALDPAIVSGCSGPPGPITGKHCYVCGFSPADNAPGVRNFRLETMQWHDMLAVNITQVSIW